MSAATQPHDDAGVVRAARVVRGRWWIVALTAVVFVAASLGMSLRAAKEYEATSRLVLGDPGFSSVVGASNVLSGSLDPQRASATDVMLMTSTQVAERVRRALRLSVPAEELAGQASATAVSGADLAEISVRDADPARAAAIANAFAEQYVAFRTESDRGKISEAITELRQQLATTTDPSERTQLQDLLSRFVGLRLLQFGKAEVVGRASVPTTAVSPTPARDAVIALFLGIAVGVGIVFLLDLFDRRVKTVEEFEAIFRTRAIAAIPQEAFGRSEKDAAVALEAYRMVRNGLPVLKPSGAVRVLLVSSSTPSEGKTTLAVNLARTVALTGQRVTLVEADLRRPAFRQHLALTGEEEGLTNVLVGARDVADLLLTPEDLPELLVLPSGPLPPNSAELLGSDAMRAVLEELRETADVVIVDAPPLVPVADTHALLDDPLVDAVLMAGRVNRTTRDDARRARSILDQHSLATIGLVVTGIPETPQDYGYYGGAARRRGGRRAGRRAGARREFA